MNYGELKQKTIDLLDDQSTELAGYIDTAVRLAEDSIFNYVSELDCFKKEFNSSGGMTFNGQGTAIDEDAIRDAGVFAIGSTDDTDHEIVRSFSVEETDSNGNTKTYALEARPEEFLDLFGQPDDGDSPQFFTIKSRSPLTIRFAPFGGNSTYHYILRSYGNLHLDSTMDGSETWISRNASDALLYGTAFHAGVFLQRTDDVAFYQSNFQQAMMALGRQNNLEVNFENESGRKSKRRDSAQGADSRHWNYTTSL